MKTLLTTLLCTTLIMALTGCTKKEPATVSKAKLLVQLPSDCNTPDGATLDAKGNIILSIPNFNNTVLLEAGNITEESPARLLSISPDNKVSSWYAFADEDLHADTGKVGPMDSAFGPDGNLYLADNQFFYDVEQKSRLLRIICEDGKPVRCEVAVTGFIVSNAVAWNGNTIYVSETQLVAPEEGGKLTSGVYAITLDEMNKGPVALQPYDADNQDPHLVAVYETSGRIGFGADGLCFDDDGNLYCGIFEDGIIYKTAFDADGKAQAPTILAQDPKMACADGIDFRTKDQKIYVADMLNNAVQVVDLKGNVETLHANPDATGEDGLLDGPCEVLIRGDEVVVVNMDMPWECEWLLNGTIEEPYTVSYIALD